MISSGDEERPSHSEKPFSYDDLRKNLARILMERTGETSRKGKKGRCSACRTEGHRENRINVRRSEALSDL